MNEVTNEKLMTTKEIAEQLGTRPNVITENAKKCLPDKVIENGKTTYWTQAEVAVLIEQLKCNQVNGSTFPNLSVELKGSERCERDSAITTMQFAKQLGTTPNVVLENARKCLPNKRIENGKPTFWTKEEVTVVLDYMKAHTSNNRSVELNSTVANTSTELTPALKLKKALELAQEAYEEELQILRAKTEEQERTIAEQKPKALAYDEFVSRGKFCNFRDAANYLHTKQGTFMSLLKSKYIYKNEADEYRCYSQYSNYFALRPFTVGDRTRQQLMLTLEGLNFFRNKIGGEQA